MPPRSSDTPQIRLGKSVEDALKIYAELQRLITFRSQMPGGNSVTGRAIHSQPPWNTPVAFSFLELHQLARELEDRFCYYAKLPLKKRGGSDENTRLALETVCRYTEAVPESAVVAADRDLDRWIRHARIVLGELELPQRLPRLPGQTEPSCPFCRHRTLRMFPLQGIVTCVMPISICKDAEGRKPRAKMEWSRFTQNFELVWQDNVVGIPA